jgi:anti-sigma factor RsiW
MMVDTAARGPHLDDDALLRLIDREGSAAERARLAAHVEVCGDCHQRHAALATWSRGMSAVLAEADPPAHRFALVRQRRARQVPRFWPAAAAAVLLVLGTVALGAPVRTWVVGRWAGLRRLLDDPKAVGPVQTPPRAPAAPVGVVSFIPDSDVLLVQVATRQAEGSLVLETSATPTASAAVRGQGEHEAIVVLPSELRIANTAQSRATYRITLPARLKRVVVVIDDDPAVSLTPVTPGESRALDLKVKRRR